MSVEKLILGESPIKIELVCKNEKFYATLFDKKVIGGIVLDRNQAHLLYLFLQEHLKCA